MARSIGIGHQDFEKLIVSNNFYIDKTQFIKEWWENNDAVTLITRPRRFGKTLTMSMTEQFFSVRYAGRGELFENFSVWKEEKYRALQGTYPVLSLSFANVKETDYTSARKKICQILADLYADYAFIPDSGVLGEADMEFFRRVSVDMDDVNATLAVHHLSKYLNLYYGRKVILLLDEYDTPMQEAYVGGYWEQLVAFMRNFFNASFKTNPWAERAVMTGITRIAKESIFSDLNNLKVVTTTSEEYSDSFGFTEEEVFGALDEFGMSCRKQEVKSWYDGFTFGSCKDIYNPWSIINFLDTGKLVPYWANTSANSLTGKLIREGSADVKRVMEDLLKGERFHTRIDEQIVFNQLDHNESAIWSLLLASGYLKVENYSIDEESGREEYELSLTNREVRIMFERMISDWFTNFTPAYNAFIRALLLGDVKAMNAYMNRVALTTFSYFDTGKSPSREAEPERFYHGFVLGLMVELAGRYVITSNRESGFGRYDVVLEPVRVGDDAIVMEFKVHDPEDEETLRDTVKEALRQIEDKKYDTMLKAKGIPAEKIRKYGFAFEGKKVLVG